MHSIYITFGQKYGRQPHPTWPDADPEGWLTVNVSDAPDPDAAYTFVREWAARTLENAYAFLYMGEYFWEGDDPHLSFPKGELGSVTVVWTP